MTTKKVNFLEQERLRTVHPSEKILATPMIDARSLIDAQTVRAHIKPIHIHTKPRL